MIQDALNKEYSRFEEYVSSHTQAERVKEYVHGRGTV
jgi:hypothetical protein